MNMDEIDALSSNENKYCTKHSYAKNVQKKSLDTTTTQHCFEKLSRPAVFDKMEALLKDMQDPGNGVPVRQQKLFLTSIPYAFMGYDLIEWLMDRLSIEEAEALSIANQLCLYGYFFPVNDTKTLIVKDDSSLYRFQTPYYWPWQHKAPDNVEYAIYLCKRSLRNKQRHGLEDYENDALNSLHKNLKGKWDIISMQAEEQVRLAKERKKGDKIVTDSQERAYWRVHRPPPGQFTPLESCPVPRRDRQGAKSKKRTVEDWNCEVDFLKKSLNRTRMKMSQICESLKEYSKTFVEYDFFLHTALPSNPWVSDDTTFWQLNNAIVDVPTEKRVKRWSISIEELVSDPTGLQEFTTFLEKEYSHENIRFWIAVNKLRRSAYSQVSKKVSEIYEEFLKPGAPCEINIDSKTMEEVQRGLKNPSRFTFDAAAEHVYTLLLKKDCYPRFIRSDHYKSLLACGIQPSQKKRFFGFGGVTKKKSSTNNPSTQVFVSQGSSCITTFDGLSRRRGSERSVTGSTHDLPAFNRENLNEMQNIKSQTNLFKISYRETVNQLCGEVSAETGLNTACLLETPIKVETPVILSTCLLEKTSEQKQPNMLIMRSPSSDISEASELVKKISESRAYTGGDEFITEVIGKPQEQRRASIAVIPKYMDFQTTSIKQNVTTASTTQSNFTLNYCEQQALVYHDSEDAVHASTIGNVETVVGPEISSYKLNSAGSEGTDNICLKYFELNIRDLKNNNIHSENNGSGSLFLSLNKVGHSQNTSLEIDVDVHDPCSVTKYVSNELVCMYENKVETVGYKQSPSQIFNTSIDLDETFQEITSQEELPGTVKGYQKCQQLAVTPTQVSAIAPLAEIEIDSVEEEQKCSPLMLESQEKRKKQKIRDSEKITAKVEGSHLQLGNCCDNAVCPWEDENVDSSSSTFVKTYATLGYL